MKVGTHQKIKFQVLKRLLALRQYEVTGILECLWLLTATNAPRGDIGRFSNLELVVWIEWPGDPDRLVDALVQSGWLDHQDRKSVV